MPESLPKAMLCLIGGLALGTTGGYFWGADSQPATFTNMAHPASELASNTPSQTTATTSHISAAIQNPTGLRLVGTVVQPERSKSKAWVMQVDSDTTQAYGESDTLPGGYRLNVIDADELQLNKDGYSFVIRRSSASSGENANAPCQALAQNGADSHGAKSRSSTQESPARHRRGMGGQSRSLTTQQQEQERSQNASRKQSVHKSWGNKTTVEGENVLDEGPREDVVIPPAENESP